MCQNLSNCSFGTFCYIYTITLIKLIFNNIILIEKVACSMNENLVIPWLIWLLSGNWRSLKVRGLQTMTRLCVFVNKVSGDISLPIYLYVVCCFSSQWQNWVVAIEIVWPEKPKYLLLAFYRITLPILALDHKTQSCFKNENIHSLQYTNQSPYLHSVVGLLLCSPFPQPLVGL